MVPRNVKKNCPGRKVRPWPKVLDRLTGTESTKLLRVLLERHANLRTDAESIAADLVGASSPRDITDSVYSAVTSLDFGALNERAGSTRWGYVEPTDAAWELLEEGVEGFVHDMKRRMEAGFLDAALSLCRGIIAGLYKAEDHGSGDVLEWAPDFPKEEAESVVSELLRVCPRKDRTLARSRICTLLAEEAPLWSTLLARRSLQTIQQKSSMRRPVLRSGVKKVRSR